MSDDPKNRRSGSWFSAWAFALLFAYPLSVGPATWVFAQVGRHGWYEGAFLTVYSPLVQLGEHSPTFKNLLDWYVRLWY